MSECVELGEVRAWTIESLEGLTRAEVALSNRLLGLLPLGSFEDSALVRLSGWLHELTGRRYQFELYRLGRHAAGAELSELGDSFSAWFELPPDLLRGALVVDPQIMEDLVGGLLEQPCIGERFSEEANPYPGGVGLYLVMRMIEKLGALGLPPLMLGTSDLDAEDLALMLEIELGSVVEVVFTAHGEAGHGLVRLFLPGGVIQAVEMYAKNAPGRRESRDFMNYGPFADLPIRLSVGIARVMLTAAEFRDLESEDVVFFGEHGLQVEGLEGGEIEHGRVYLSARKFLVCDVFEGVDGFWNARLCGDGAQIQEGTMAEEEVSQERTAYLANGATVMVEVRVGQVLLSVGELTRLQSGHVMVLDRDVARGVELVVDGRVIGAGELVNVEGALGVRVQWMGVR